MAKFSTGSSQRVVDLRKKKPGAHMSALWSAPEKRERRSPLRRRRIRHRAIGALALVALAAAVTYGVSYASYLPQLSVGNIVVQGAAATRPELVRAFVGTKLYDGTYSFISPTNIFLYPRESIETALEEKFPRVRNATISRASLLATALVVSLEEREPFARWCPSNAHGAGSSGECFLMSNGGYIFDHAKVGARTEVPYVFRGGVSATTSAIGERYLEDDFSRALALIEHLAEAAYETTEFVAEDGRDVTLVFAKGFSVRAVVTDEPDSLVQNMQLVLSSEALRGKESQLEYIDLRFGNRVYYKLVNSEQKTANGTE